LFLINWEFFKFTSPFTRGNKNKKLQRRKKLPKRRDKNRKKVFVFPQPGSAGLGRTYANSRLQC
jgi:hypothetical protein